MPTCKELTDVVTDYLEGRMSVMRRVSFRLHLGMCDRCRAYLRQMKMTIETLGRLPDEPVPAEVREALLTRFRTIRPSGAPVTMRRRTFVAAFDDWLRSRGWMVVGMVLFGAALLGVLLGGQPGPLLGTWERCLLVELGVAALPVVGVGVAAVRMRERIAASSLAAVAAIGALVGYLHLQLACPYSRVTVHALVIDVGGILLAALLGAAASRLPALRPPAPSGGA
ncbi:MAG TPA: zf-HC2 domain-containing protein [Candidatus Limnocylindria bacterium]|nr:zf-HC2 domain-containing protein [Candidatus Limnocylindria bacterium]